MTIKEKIQYSEDKTVFTLFKEGLFYKCYNEDAMVFSKRVKSYKVNSKFIKSLGAAVFSLGFPMSEVTKGNLSLASVSEKIGAKGFEECDGNIVFSLHAIASVLSSLDDKIDLLHRQNKTLEEMAEALFRQWFLPAEASAQAGVVEASEEWETITLYDAIELVGGGTPKTSVDEYWNGDIKWLSGGDIAANHKSIINASEKTITQEGLDNSSAKLLPKYSTVISARGTVGKYCILSEPMAYSQSNYGIKPRFDGCCFFTYLLVNYSVKELNSAAYGSVFDTITTNTFKGLEITIPPEKDIHNFEEKIKDYFLKMSNKSAPLKNCGILCCRS